MKFSLIRNSKATMIKIIIVLALRHNIPVQKKKHIALNQNQEKQAQAILIINIDHMPVKIHMITFIIIIITLRLKRNLKNKEKTIMKMISKNHTKRSQQILIDNKNMHDLRLHGKNSKEENNFKSNNNFVTRRLSKKKWETNSKLWEVSLRLIMCFGEGIIFVMII